jgi:Xaa-Pro aminopeptidase
MDIKMKVIKIPDYEYKERNSKAAKIARERGLDLLLFNSTESDFASVKYFSGYYTLWERCGIAISADGQAALISGPEGVEYASYFTVLDKVYGLREYRESADPDYPEIKTQTFEDVFNGIGVTGKSLKIGLGCSLDTNVAIYLGLKKAYPRAEIVFVDDIMVDLRKHKSDNEIACLREAYRITEIAIEEVIKNLKPGMSEAQAVGYAQKAIYENGAEYEGMVQYIFSDEATRHALGRPKVDRLLKKNSFVHLNIAARVDGYSASVGFPISMGKFTEEQRKFVQFGLDVHNWVKEQLKPGVDASKIATGYIDFFNEHGFGKNYVYGPLHGLGMIEVEAPWVETSSNFKLEPNYTFQVDNFILGEEFGFRWEEGVVITKSGYELLATKPIGKFYELGF